ncbi:hypothetical protein WA026_002525 [Henosepilachna vigintioctopunctata]|uniref:Uncharacterized protein n=1 Tax=Henosepilachna vigintioctopunctata TaxID=420089 RepID=A0AAW1U0G1_9CUCU
MLKPLLVFTKLICINYLIENRVKNENYALVIDYEELFDFSTIRINQKNLEVPECHLHKPAVYIVNLDVTNMRYFFNVRKHLGFDHLTKYIFIGRNFTYKAERELFLFVVKDAVFINSMSGDIYLRSIYTNSKIGGKLGNCFEKSQNLNETFSDALIRHNGKSRINVCFFDQDPYAICTKCNKKGIDIDIQTMVYNLINVTTHFVKKKPPLKEVTKQFNYVFSTGECEVMPGLLSIDGFDFSYTYLFDSMHWVVHVSDEIPKWRYAFKIFSPHIWFVWILSSISLSLALYLTTYEKNNRCQVLSLFKGLLLISKLFLEQPNEFITSKLSQWIIFVTILISTYLINLFYKSRFIYLLSGFVYEKSVDSFEDIMNNKLIMDVIDEMKIIFYGDERVIEYFEKYQIANKSKNWNFIGVDRKTTALCTKRAFLYKIADFLDEDGRPTIKLIDEPVTKVFKKCVLAFGNPLINLLSAKLTILNEHGFVPHISSKYVAHEIKRNPALDVKKLTLSNLQLPIGLWVTGIIISFISLICELYF